MLTRTRGAGEVGGSPSSYSYEVRRVRKSPRSWEGARRPEMITAWGLRGRRGKPHPEDMKRSTRIYSLGSGKKKTYNGRDVKKGWTCRSAATNNIETAPWNSQEESGHKLSQNYEHRPPVLKFTGKNKDW